MNFFAKDKALPSTDRIGSALMHGVRRVTAIGVVASMLLACATQTAPVKSTRPAPAASLHTVDAHAFEQDKLRVKRKLANGSRNALEPGEVGYYLDVLQGRLKQTSAAGTVVGGGFDRIVLDLSQGVNFVAGTGTIAQGGCNRLAPLARIFLEYRKTLISVRVSAADDVAAALQLAQTRARSVAACFTAAGISAKRIVVVGLPATAPKSKRRSQARVHVEVQIEPIVRRG
ncbi:MAG TPA: OmpA family protein [Rudaea sp.]|nr:OmpA family protein [Rudaea sp.]